MQRLQRLLPRHRKIVCAFFSRFPIFVTFPTMFNARVFFVSIPCSMFNLPYMFFCVGFLYNSIGLTHGVYTHKSWMWKKLSKSVEETKIGVFLDYKMFDCERKHKNNNKNNGKAYQTKIISPFCVKTFFYINIQNCEKKRVFFISIKNSPLKCVRACSIKYTLHFHTQKKHMHTTLHHSENNKR